MEMADMQLDARANNNAEPVSAADRAVDAAQDRNDGDFVVDHTVNESPIDSIRPPSHILASIFSNPKLVKKIARQPKVSPVIQESFEAPVYIELVPRLSVPWQNEQRLYTGDRIRLFDGRGFEILRIEQDGQLILEYGAVHPDLVSDRETHGRYGQRAGGLEIVHVGIGLFSDATSGNTSTAWNYIDGWQLRVHSLPRELQDMWLLNCTRSHDFQPVVAAILDDLERLRDGIVLYDAYQMRRVLVVGTLISLTADGPRLAQLLSLAGPKGTYNCPSCFGSRLQLEAGEPRTIANTRQHRENNHDEKASIRTCGISLKPNVLIDRTTVDAFSLFAIE
jgi:hypothetical protein